jgi:hypothetical protein
VCYDREIALHERVSASNAPTAKSYALPDNIARKVLNRLESFHIDGRATGGISLGSLPRRRPCSPYRSKEDIYEVHSRVCLVSLSAQMSLVEPTPQPLYVHYVFCAPIEGQGLGGRDRSVRTHLFARADPSRSRICSSTILSTRIHRHRW